MPSYAGHFWFVYVKINLLTPRDPKEILEEIEKTKMKNSSMILLIINLIVLTLTLGGLVWYAWDTHRIANQTQEGNLRPVILRSAFIESWQKVKFQFNENKLIEGKPLEFTILKNIATDINGYIVIDGYKYKLLFGNDISKLGENLYYFSENWGWMKPDTNIFAIFREDGNKKVNEENKIFLNYKDIEGNKYFTIEDANFSQKSFVE